MKRWLTAILVFIFIGGLTVTRHMHRATAQVAGTARTALLDTGTQGALAP
jgi:hypothetical protein